MKAAPTYGRQNNINKEWGFDLRSISHAKNCSFGKVG